MSGRCPELCRRIGRARRAQWEALTVAPVCYLWTSTTCPLGSVHCPACVRPMADHDVPNGERHPELSRLCSADSTVDDGTMALPWESSPERSAASAVIGGTMVVVAEASPERSPASAVLGGVMVVVAETSPDRSAASAVIGGMMVVVAEASPERSAASAVIGGTMVVVAETSPDSSAASAAIGACWWHWRTVCGHC